MLRQRKIKRTPHLYKRDNPIKRVLGTLLFIVLIVALVALGYVIAGEFSRRAKEPKPDTSSIPVPVSSNIPDSSDTAYTSSETDQKSDTYVTAFMPYTVYEGKNTTQINSWIADKKSAGFNSIMVELKDEIGIIHYQTNSPLAAEYKAISPNAADATALVAAIRDADLIPQACISAMKDRTAPRIERKNAYAYADQLDVNWWDDSAVNGGKPWLNPYMPAARDYIASLTREALNCGFDWVVLTNVMFPDKNTQQMNVISESMSREEILKKVLADASVDKQATYGYYLPNDVEKARAVIVEAQRIYSETYSMLPLMTSDSYTTLKPLLDEFNIDDYVIY